MKVHGIRFNDPYCLIMFVAVNQEVRLPIGN